jgi:glutamyl-Q tRNA(Asp) synthetase
MQYRGRFAPSATGALHLGSIFAALISYLDARHHQGTWLIRIDDLDRLRCKPEFNTLILKTLESFGLVPDEPPTFQSQRIEHYQRALTQLDQHGLLYNCTCSRRQLPRGPYPGHCRGRLHRGEALEDCMAVRIDTQDLVNGFDDQIQGGVQPDHPGDFIVKRRDGIIAYQLACAIDESIDDITHVIRGIDLLPSTPMQRFISQRLGLTCPAYGHFPILIDSAGAKLSKQTFAAPVEPATPGSTYAGIAALLLLNDTPERTDSPATWLRYFQDLGDIRKRLPHALEVSAEMHKTR